MLSRMRSASLPQTTNNLRTDNARETAFGRRLQVARLFRVCKCPSRFERAEVCKDRKSVAGVPQQTFVHRLRCRGAQRMTVGTRCYTRDCSWRRRSRLCLYHRYGCCSSPVSGFQASCLASERTQIVSLPLHFKTSRPIRHSQMQIAQNLHRPPF